MPELANLEQLGFLMKMAQAFACATRGGRPHCDRLKHVVQICPALQAIWCCGIEQSHDAWVWETLFVLSPETGILDGDGDAAPGGAMEAEAILQGLIYMGARLCGIGAL